MANEDVTLRLRMLDEFSATTRKFADEMRKLETGTKTTNAHLGTMSDKLRALEQIGVPGMGRLSAGMGKAEAGAALFGKTLSTGVVVGLGVAATAAIAYGLAVIKSVAAASEGEQATMRLSAALKAQGLYSEAAVSGVQDWAEALLRTKGVNDELSATLVAQGLTMGLSIKQSQDFISLAADMAPIVGSIGGAFEMLARASAGDERALMMLGKQFGIAKTAGLDFGEMADEIARKTSGYAAAALDTFKGQWGLLGEEINNFLEKRGTPLMTWLAGQPKQIEVAIDAWSKFGSWFANDPVFKAIGAVLNGPKNLYMSSPLAPGIAYDGKDTTHDIANPAARFSEAGAIPYSKVWFDEAKKSREAIAKFGKEDEAEAKKARAERAADVKRGWAVQKEIYDADEAEQKDSFARAQEALTNEGRLYNQRQAHLEAEKKLLQEDLEMRRDVTAARLALVQQGLAGEQGQWGANALAYRARVVEHTMSAEDWRTNGAQQRLTGGATYGPNLVEARNLTAQDKFLKTAEIKNLQDKILRLRTQDGMEQELADAEDALQQLKLDNIQTQSEMALALTDSIVGMIRGGGIGKGVSGIGASLGKAGAIDAKYAGAAQLAGNTISTFETQGLGASIGSVVGGIIGGVIAGIYSEGTMWQVGAGVGQGVGGAIGSLFDSEKAANPFKTGENQVGSMISYGTQTYSEADMFLNGKGKRYDTASTPWGAAQAGISDSWSHLIAPGSSGDKLQLWLDELGLSMGDAAIQVAKLVEEANGINAGQAKMQVALAGFGVSALTNAQASDLAGVYKEGQGQYAAWQSFQSGIQQRLDSMSKMDKGSAAWDAASKDLATFNNSFTGMIPPAEKTAANTDKMVSLLQTIAGVTPETKHTGQFPAFHEGKLQSWEKIVKVRRDEIIAPPERFSEASEYLRARGFGINSGGSGGNTYIINGAVGSYRDIHRMIRDQDRSAVIRRDVRR